MDLKKSLKIVDSKSGKNPKKVKDKKKKNGFTTTSDMAKYLVIGSIFWITVMVLANFLTSHLHRFKPGHGSFCLKGFKKCYKNDNYGWCADQLHQCFYENFNNKTFFFQDEPRLITPNFEPYLKLEVFSETEQKANEQQCHYLASIEAKMCDTLCDNDISKIYDCLGVCMALGAKTKSEYCPFDLNCPDGCPCPNYDCELGIGNSAGLFALEKYQNYTSSHSFIIAGVNNDTVIPAQKFKLETEDSLTRNMCSIFFGSMHYIFESNTNFEYTEDGFKITNALKIFVVDEVFGVVKQFVIDVKDNFSFTLMSTCGKGFFVELEGVKHDCIYLCTPITDQGLVCEH